MSLFDYAKMQTTASQLLTRFGQTMTLRQFTDGAYSAGALTQTSVDTSVTGVLTDYSDYEATNELIEANDRKITLAAAGITTQPNVTDQLIAGVTTYKIVNVKSINPAGTPVIYELQVRQ